MDEVAFGRYQLRELIGEGGMGHVYKAYDTVIGRDVAIKVLPPEMATLAGYQERFRREAQIAARLTEPHIIPIHDTGEIDGRLYLVMPIVEGIDVQTVLQREGAMTPARAVRVIEQLAAALNAAHRNGLVHRDIKPSNALMTPDEHIYLIDFGIAHDASATRMTQTGMMVGTVSYMAPERFLEGTVDARADVYALTCVLHECLTGATPFRGTSMEQQIAAHLTMEPPRPSVLNSAIPVGFDEVIARGMAKKPEQRYQSAAELAAAAQQALNGAPAPPQPNAPRPPVTPITPTVVETRPSPMPSHAPEPAEDLVGLGTFAYALFGVVVLWSATTGLLAPWRDASWKASHNVTASLCMWAAILTVIPGLVLLVLGRGRAHPAKTMAGRALVTLGLGTLLFRLLGWELPVPLAIAGVLAAVVPLYPRSRQLVRGYLICGLGVLALALFDLLLQPVGWVRIGSWHLVFGAAVGVLWVTATAVGGRSSTQTPESLTTGIGAGRFACALSGVVLLASTVAALLVRRVGDLDLHYSTNWNYYEHAAVGVWLFVLGAIPGIALLVLGRGRAHPDQTITGCALVALAVIAPAIGQFREDIPPIAALIPAVLGLLLLLIPVFGSPSRALARACLSCGAGILVWTLIYWILRSRNVWSPISNLLISSGIGGLLLAAGGIALLLSRRTEKAGPLPAPPRR